jgi:hypothetical protein
MTFSDIVIKQAWRRANGKCECRRKTHGHHYVRCNKQLVWSNRGRECRGAWEAHHTVKDRPDTFSNCEILCWSCHSKTF